jgi:two-component system, OmpR family, alkaline phosphatase synthesis response regulator PhoP
MENKDFRILLADDEPDILEFLGYNLQREGYQVFKAKNGKKAVEKALEIKPHLVILDVMMPEMDGMEACNEMRRLPELNSTIIAFLTARGEDYSQIAGFDAGADDYITKPIKPKVFISRIQALLRRFRDESATTGGGILLATRDFTIDRDKFVVIRDGKEYFLPKKEFELLHFLASSPNKVFSRDEIFSAVWGDDVVVGDRTIDVHIRRIREKLEIDSIRTIKGVGYKFEER